MWRSPHHFIGFADSIRPWLQGAAGDDLDQLIRTQDAFTVGLLVPEICEGDLKTAEGVQRLGERVGFEWLGSLADALRDDGRPSSLTRWMRSFGVKAPGQGSWRLAFAEGARDGVPETVLSRFAREAQSYLNFERETLAPFAHLLTEAARKRSRPRALDDRELEWIRTWLSLDGAHIEPTNQGWALVFGNLRDRLWWELLELFETRPRLHVCPLCERVYVPRTSAQTRCQRGLFAWPSGKPLRGCVPLPALDSDQHRREYKRLVEARRRARIRHEREHSGASRTRLTDAEAKLADYRQKNFGYAGRPVKGEPPRMTKRTEDNDA